MEEKEMEKKKKLLRLFIETLYLSAFTFGGGTGDPGQLRSWGLCFL